ncbi:hypothetical protein HNP46_006489 [Pseudomonas nitritireducens]|uniref:Uncharacterized protein n=1 Tax=Pseudomonas nitroreducens TaxID=46680 RepID=A0A7W7P5D4_PSENT|nr:hypothetical protein [Pseudomonas nitritireducens]MBB4867575.1 hypothetical protein [Pseudomonas nitritireducens]
MPITNKLELANEIYDSLWGVKIKQPAHSNFIKRGAMNLAKLAYLSMAIDRTPVRAMDEAQRVIYAIAKQFPNENQEFRVESIEELEAALHDLKDKTDTISRIGYRSAHTCLIQMSSFVKDPEVQEKILKLLAEYPARVCADSAPFYQNLGLNCTIVVEDDFDYLAILRPVAAPRPQAAKDDGHPAP